MQQLFLKVTVDRDAAILAGKDIFGTFDVPLAPSQLTAEQREILVSLPTNGLENIVFPKLDRPIASVEPADVPALLDELKVLRKRQEEEELAEVQKKYDEWRPKFLAKEIPQPDSMVVAPEATELPLPGSDTHLVWWQYPNGAGTRMLSCHDLRAPIIKVPTPEKLSAEIVGFGQIKTGSMLTRIILGDTEVMARIEAAHAIKDQLQATMNEIHAQMQSAAKKRREKREQEEVDAKQRRADQISGWVAQNATIMQKKRFAAGLLPEEEILKGMRNGVFAPLDNLPRYKKITKSELTASIDQSLDHIYGYDLPVEFAVSEPTSVTDEQFAMFEMIKERLSQSQNVKISLKEHVAYYEDYKGANDPEVRRLSAHVEVKVGEITFAREYAID